MKGFEKWWKEEGFYFEYEAMCEDTWESALKWILSKVEQSNSDGSIIQYINDELKEN